MKNQNRYINDFAEFASQMYYNDQVENFPMYTFRKPSGNKPSLTCNA